MLTGRLWCEQCIIDYQRGFNELLGFDFVLEVEKAKALHPFVDSQLYHSKWVDEESRSYKYRKKTDESD